MTLRAKAKLVAMLLASPLVAAPTALAGSGGSGSGSGSGGVSPGGAPVGPAPVAAPRTTPTGGAPSAGTAPATQNGNLQTTVTANGITVTTRISSLLGHRLAFIGTAPATSRGAAVVVQRFDPEDGWVSVATGTVGAGGAFETLWRTNYAGRLTMRTVIVQSATASQTAQTLPTLQVTVYRPAIATYYGKGFFGQTTACGMKLRRATLGVASRTLKCGTPVEIYYGGRTIVVPVIDRGPYANHASWDLTQATAAALGITGTETIGAVAG